MTIPTPRFTSELEKKSYESGMRIVNQKLSMSGKPTAGERASRQLAAGHRIIVGKIGAAAAFKSYGISLPKPISRPVAKAAQPTANKTTIKCLSVKRLHRYGAGGLFA